MLLERLKSALGVKPKTNQQQINDLTEKLEELTKRFEWTQGRLSLNEKWAIEIHNTNLALQKEVKNSIVSFKVNDLHKRLTLLYKHLGIIEINQTVQTVLKNKKK